MLSTHAGQHFLPAMGRDWLLPLYDPLTALLGLNSVRRRLIDHAALTGGSRVLDVGCGTGTLAILIKKRNPAITVVALDPDGRALAKGERKARRAGTTIDFNRGFAGALPFPDRSFDRVFSSLMLHHLDPDAKAQALREIRRVLRPNGRFHLADFSPSVADGGLSRLHSHRRLTDNSESHLLALLTDAGFADAAVVASSSLLGGRLRVAYFQAAV